MIVPEAGPERAGPEAVMASRRGGKVRKNESMGYVDAALDGLDRPRSAVLLERFDAAAP